MRVTKDASAGETVRSNASRPAARADSSAVRTDSSTARRDSAMTTAAPNPTSTTSTPAPDASALLSSMTTDAQAMGLLHAANTAEIQAGTLAQRRSQNADVRAFAERMVTEHTQLDQQGSALATQLGLSPMLPDSTLPRLQAEGARMLDSATTAFDLAYVTGQVADHQRTLAIVDAAIAKAQNEQLRTALQTQVRPAVAMHLQMAQQLAQKLGGR